MIYIINLDYTGERSTKEEYLEDFLADNEIVPTKIEHKFAKTYKGILCGECSGQRFGKLFRVVGTKQWTCFECVTKKLIK